MRLIDADALKKDIYSSADRAVEGIGIGHLLEKLVFEYVVEAFVKKIDEQPTVKNRKKRGKRK